MNNLQRAIELHQQGNLTEARKLYSYFLHENSNSFDALHLSGIAAFETGNFYEAIDFYTKAFKINPNFAPLYSNLGNTLKALRLFDEALESYDKAISIEPHYTDAFNNKGVALQEMNRFFDALSCYDEAIKIDPNLAHVFFNRGLVLQEMDSFEEALKNLDNAIHINAYYPEAFLFRGIILKKTLRFNEAFESFNTAISIRPDYAEAFYQKGNLFIILEKFDYALESLDKTLSIKSDYAEAYYSQGVALQALQRFDEALQSYAQAIAKKPDFPDAFNNRGIIFSTLQRYDEALASFDKAILIKTDYPEALFYRGNTLRQMLRFGDALKSFNTSLSIKSDYVQAFNERGLLLIELKEFHCALESFDNAISIKPDYAEAFNNRGVALHALQRFDEALQCYDQAISIMTNYAEAFYNRGITLRALRRFDESLQSYDQAIANKFDFPDAYINRGATLKEMNRYDEALASFDKAISIKPDNAIAINNRAITLLQLGRLKEAKNDWQYFIKIAAKGLDQDLITNSFLVDFCCLDFLPACYSSIEALDEHFVELDEKLKKLLIERELCQINILNLQALVAQISFNLNGFYIAYLQKDVVDILSRYSQIMSAALGVNTVSVAFKNRRGNKIKLGIASALMKNHNGVNWAYNWIANLPHDYEIFTYAFNLDTDELTFKFSQLGTHRSLPFDKDSFLDTINQIKSDDLDILMLPDVGMTPQSRILSLYRIAPIQFSAWGHPITTGSENIDYYLSSDLMEPADAQSHYSEKLIRLPNLALFLPKPILQEVECIDFGLPDTGIFYGCLQSNFKYLPQHDYVYPLIAKRNPNSVFIFLEGETAYSTAIIKQRLETEFCLQGLDYNSHVKFLPRVSSSGYLALIARMDVILDSIGWTGANTSLQAIELGKPIVTIPGKFMRGRHTYAMFKMMGLDHHNSASIQDYINRAIELGLDINLRFQASREILSRKQKLYEDQCFINALDSFLKEAVAQHIPVK